MTGQSLYEKWAEEMGEEGVGVDPWEALENPERKAWVRLATRLDGLARRDRP